MHLEKKQIMIHLLKKLINHPEKKITLTNETLNQNDEIKDALRFMKRKQLISILEKDENTIIQLEIDGEAYIAVNQL
ncbi:MAG TPA: hypothetical protein VLA13_03690 [Massilibacterium sp.]|nr:hypothetical protein [Massilibacterium sp.]